MGNECDIEEFDKLSQIPKDKIYFFKKSINSWYKINKKSYPWRVTKDPYKILLAEILLQQTNVRKVLPVYNEMIDKYPTIHHLSNTRYMDILQHFKFIGLNYKAKRINEICNIIINNYNSQIPKEESELKLLPGIGNYIARAICCNAYDSKCSVVDTNVIRLLGRFFGIIWVKRRPRDDKTVWLFANKLLPRKAKESKHWNWGLLDFAGAICTHYNPKCKKCPLKNKCEWISSIN